MKNESTASSIGSIRSRVDWLIMAAFTAPSAQLQKRPHTAQKTAKVQIAMTNRGLTEMEKKNEADEHNNWVKC